MRCAVAACVLALMPLTPCQADDDSSPIFVSTSLPDTALGVIARFMRRRFRRASRHSWQPHCHGRLPERDACVPDGAILAKLAWKRDSSSSSPAFSVPGRATTVQSWSKTRRDMRRPGMGLRPLHCWQGRRSRATRDMFRLPSGQCEGSRLLLRGSLHDRCAPGRMSSARQLSWCR